MSIRNAIFVSLLASGGMLLAQSSGSTLSREYSFSSVGLGSTETAQINVSNISLLPSPAASAAATPGTCTGSVSFLNAAGATIGKAMPFSVTPGQTFSAPLAFASAALTGIRGQVRGVVAVNTVLNGLIQPGCGLALSFETFDTVTGASHVVLSNPTLATYASPVTALGAR